MDDLFSPFRIGELDVENRMVMAPMTRSRASDEGVQSAMAVEYYTQRASAGLIITEGSPVSAQGVGYVKTPGIYNVRQMEAWKPVVDSVRNAGGKIFLQLWHVGRVSHPDFHSGALPVAPSAIAFDGSAYTREGMKKVPVPRALKTEEIPEVVQQFADAAGLAKRAGFDGVEIHGANGYLLDQFLRDGSNQRKDEFGGDIENRARFPLQVVEAVLSHFDASSVGYRVSPNNPFHGMHDSDTVGTFSYLARRLSELRLGFLHVFEYVPGHAYGPVGDQVVMTPILRETFDGAYIVNGGYGSVAGHRIVREGGADLVAFGIPFLANPDLPARFRRNAPLNTPDEETFYQGGAKGYVDYSALPATF